MYLLHIERAQFFVIEIVLVMQCSVMTLTGVASLRKIVYTYKVELLGTV